MFGASVCAMRSATLVRISLVSRSQICRAVTSLPSIPASGPSLTANCIWMVGGSIGTKGSGCRVDDVGDGLADEHVLESGHAHHVPGVRFGDLDPLQSLKMKDAP